MTDTVSAIYRRELTRRSVQVVDSRPLKRGGSNATNESCTRQAAEMKRRYQALWKSA